jgi:hypothetical protein
MRVLCRSVPVVLATLSLALLVTPRSGQTVPLYAARTGLMCETCHFDPNGGGPRNEFGFAFARNRHLLTPEDSTSHWAGLSVGNRVGESTPLYFGVNQRFMLLTNQNTGEDRPERLGFFNMESALHIAFQPHDRLTLVYTLDGFADGPVNSVSSKEAFGMLTALPGNGYLKAGRFRVPFGLRMDDHTVATRDGFGEFGVGSNFLPYDPRLPDMGIEYGASRGHVFGRASFTNGSSSVLSGGHAEAKAVKVGLNSAWYQGGVSLYDDFVKLGTTPHVRYTFWSYYGMGHRGPFALLGEIAFGTDAVQPSVIPPNGAKSTSLAGFTEVDWAPARQYNFRVRYDHLEHGREQAPPARDMSTFNRYSLEGEWVPVPFAELRWALRYIDTKFPASVDDQQAYLQFHFSY